MTTARRVSPVLTRHRGAITYDERTPEIAIAVIVPFDFELDWEYWRYLPQGVSLYFTRTPFVNRPVGLQLAREVGNMRTIARATRAMASLNPAATLYACSSGSFINGVAGEAQLREAMLAAGARRAVTTSGAMIDALRAANIRRVAVATPYTQQLTLSLVDFLEEAGFDVVSVHYLGLTRNLAAISRGTIADLVRTAAAPDADAVFVSCTALRTYGILAMLEQEVHCPVFTSNQVSLWAALREAGVFQNEYHREEAWVLGDNDPMARSTALLLEAAAAEAALGETG